MQIIFRYCIASLLILPLSGSLGWGQTAVGDSTVRELAVNGLALLSDKTLSVMYRVYDASGRARRYSGSVSGSLGGALDSSRHNGSSSAAVNFSIGAQRYFRTGKVSWYRGQDYNVGYSLSRSSSNSLIQYYDGVKNIDWKTISRAWQHSLGLGVTPFVGVSYAVRPQFTIGAEGRLPILLTLSQTTSRSRQTYSNATTGAVEQQLDSKQPARYQYQFSFYGSSSNLLIWLGFRL